MNDYLINSYRDNIDTIWSQFVLDDITFNYEQMSPNNTLVSQRLLFADIGSAELNQEEKTRQRHTEKNVVDIPRTQLKMESKVTFGKKKVVNITVREYRER